MDLNESIRAFATAVPNIINNVRTEEATKTGLIMPFLNMLGYNVFNPAEVCPECDADVGTKKGEKVDYAILKDGKPIMLIECKSADTDLATIHQSQLYRYFGVMTAKIGILTNGVKYLFYSDFDETNKMDMKPFFELDMLNLTDQMIEVLKLFCKDTFNVDKIMPNAMDMKFARAIKTILARDMENPSEDFVRYYAKQIYDGVLTKNRMDEFTGIVKKALSQYINDLLNSRLQNAMTKEEVEPVSTSVPEQVNDGIETTDEEIEGYNIVRAILAEIVSPERVVMRDVKSYCGILLDDNNRKPICRLYFNGQKKMVGVFTGGTGNEEKVPINKPVDLYTLSAKLKENVMLYLKK